MVGDNFKSFHVKDPDGGTIQIIIRQNAKG
jgi:hypothetical protein